MSWTTRREHDRAPDDASVPAGLRLRRETPMPPLRPLVTLTLAIVLLVGGVWYLGVYGWYDDLSGPAAAERMAAFLQVEPEVIAAETTRARLVSSLGGATPHYLRFEGAEAIERLAASERFARVGDAPLRHVAGKYEPRWWSDAAVAPGTVHRQNAAGTVDVWYSHETETCLVLVTRG